MISNFPDVFKAVRIFPDDCQFSGLFQNCPDFSKWLPIFWMISKLFRFFLDDCQFSRWFQNCPDVPGDCQFSGWFQNCPDFPDDCQFSRIFQNCPDFSRWLPIFWMISKVSGFFQMQMRGGGTQTFRANNRYFWSKNIHIVQPCLAHLMAFLVFSPVGWNLLTFH